jgi:hypothetical protein
MILRRVRQKRERVVNRPQGEDRRVGKEGVSKSETARRFVVDRATVKRYCKQLDKRGTLEPSSAPTKIPKVDEKARKLLVEDLEQRPWATHPQRAEYLVHPLLWGEETAPKNAAPSIVRKAGSHNAPSHRIVDSPRVRMEAWRRTKGRRARLRGRHVGLDRMCLLMEVRHAEEEPELR